MLIVIIVRNFEIFLYSAFKFHCEAHNSSYSNCSDGDLKLVGGSTEYEGTVLICINKAWGTVCDDYYYYTSNAQVVCNALGYSTPGIYTIVNVYYVTGFQSACLL